MTLEQKRAAAAFRHVEAFAQLHPDKSAPERKRYGSLACKLPALLLSAGLCQALHFLKSRPARSQKDALLGHLVDQFQRLDSSITSIDQLCERVRTADSLGSYLWLSREAVAVATWYARLAKSELGYEPGDEPGDEADAGGTEP